MANHLKRLSLIPLIGSVTELRYAFNGRIPPTVVS
jgi:hypothetical protein